MLQKTFDIHDSLHKADIKFIETGQKYLACWSKNSETSFISDFEFFQFDDNDFENFENLLREIKMQSQVMKLYSEKTFFIWNNSQAVCVPSAYYNDLIANDYLNLLNGEMPESVLYAQAYDQITVLYRHKIEIQQAAEKAFPGTHFSHAWSHILQNSEIDDSGNLIMLNFYPNAFTLAAFANSNLQLLQSREYNSPEDILYYFLSFFKQYDWNMDETKIFVSGLIDPQSKLYDTLHQYLTGFEIIKIPEDLFKADDFKKFPQHFFLPFANYVP